VALPIATRPVMAADDRDARVAALFHDHYAGLCRLAYLIVGERVAAEEVVMDAFLQTFVSWRRIRDLDRAPAYLRRAVVNRSRSRTRRRHIEDRSNAVVGTRPDGAGAGASSSQAWDAERHETGRVVGDAVRRLPHRQRAAVVLRYYADLSEGDIADTLGCSTGTVKSQLAKARTSLARMLDDEGDIRS
jgi:RNA polymerase sigma-70 factor (sigma-E family)